MVTQSAEFTDLTVILPRHGRVTPWMFIFIPDVGYWPKADTPKNAIGVAIGGKADIGPPSNSISPNIFPRIDRNKGWGGTTRAVSTGGL